MRTDEVMRTMESGMGDDEKAPVGIRMEGGEVTEIQYAGWSLKYDELKPFWNQHMADGSTWEKSIRGAAMNVMADGKARQSGVPATLSEIEDLLNAAGNFLTVFGMRMDEEYGKQIRAN